MMISSFLPLKDRKSVVDVSLHTYQNIQYTSGQSVLLFPGGSGPSIPGFSETGDILQMTIDAQSVFLQF